MKDNCITCYRNNCEFHELSGSPKHTLAERIYVHEILSKVGCESHIPYSAVCKHTEIIPDEITDTCATAVCKHCGKRFGWYCPKSPNHRCVYTESYDSCDYCGYPEERK